MRKRFPVSSEELDISGAVKKQTLEYFLLHPGWHKAMELRDDPELASLIPKEQSRAMQMRLVRYVRQGLLSRKRAARGYEYQMTVKGEDRLFYLWDKFGETRAEGELAPEERKTSIRLNSIKLGILETRLQTLSRSQ